MLSLMTWNIRHGGGARGMPRIALELVEQAADVIVLTEFRQRTGGQIRGVLADHGWPHQALSQTPARANSVLIASRHPIDPQPIPHSLAGRWLEVQMPHLDLWIIGLHIPCEGPDTGRKAFWHIVLRHARNRANQRAVLIGDFNTGRHHLDEQGETFTDTVMMGLLSAAGYIDAWRHLHPHQREYSWFSHTGSGFRIDHALVSNPLSGGISAAWYRQDQREQGTSDHASLTLILDPAACKFASNAPLSPLEPQQFAPNLTPPT